MREPERDNGRIQDILAAADNVSDFIKGLDFEHFCTDKLHYYAILKNVEIIGEAAYMISNDFKDSHPDIPWKEIIRMRHVLVHGYAVVLPELLWETVQNDIPSLVTMLRGFYDHNMRTELDYIAEKEYARQEARAEGQAQGKTEGQAQAKAEVAMAMLKQGLSVDVIAACTGLSKQEIDNL